MRKNWLDNLRWVTVVLVLVYHVFYVYNNKGVFGGIGGFDPDPKGQPQDVIEYILYPWFMMLLFLIAGISARYSLEHHSSREFIHSRALKLLVPSTIGLFVLQWINGYYNAPAEVLANVPSPIRYVIYSLSGIGPLWFIQELFFLSVILVLIKSIDKKDKFYNWCGKLSLPVIIIVGGVLVYLASHVLVYNPRPESMDGLLNLYRPVIYLTTFLSGYFVFSHDKIQEKLSSAGIWLFLCALISGAILIWKKWGTDYTSPVYLSSWLNCLYAWLMTLGLMGVFKSYFDKTSHFATYMTRSSFGLYIVHYVVLISTGTYLYSLKDSLPIALIYILLLFIVLVGSVLVYELLHRLPVIRWCVFGISKKK